MAFIKKSFITDKLLANVSIEKLIGQYVTVKKKGSNYWCCCPFHHEKTPSCSITPSKQMFYCFGCKEHGNAIDFLMKFKNLEFVEAVEELAQFAGLEIEYDTTNTHIREDNKKKDYFELMDRVATFFTKTLMSEEGRIGLEYFKNQRGLSDKTILEARLGFAPNSFDYVQNKICKNKEEIDALVELGVLVRNERGVHAMYRNRVMIPIFDKRGRVISFGGRTMGDDKPKYMNTKESPIYRKRQELFGLFESLKANNNRPERVAIVEGYMDVISVRQAGCTYAVASLGTATTPEQIQTLFRYTDKIIFCYDGDEAGRHAAWHALQIITPILQDGKEIRFSFLPPEHDPDSLVRAQGLSGFTNYLDNAMSYPEFLIVHQANSYNTKDPGQLANFIQNTLKLIKQIPLDSLQSVSLKMLSGPSGISETQLYDMFKNIKEEPSNRTNLLEKDNADKSKSTSYISLNPMRKLIAFIVQQPTVVLSVYDEFMFDDFVNLCNKVNVKGASQLKDILHLIKSHQNMNQANLIELTRDTPLEKIIRILMDLPLQIAFESSGDISFENKIDYLSNLLKEVFSNALKEMSNSIKIKMSQGDINAAKEFSYIQKGLIQISKN